MSDDQDTPDRPEPRSAAEIFADLRELAQTPGALHELSAIVYRDWVLTIDRKEARVVDDPEKRWSHSKLNKNELMLLLGLMVQAEDDRTYNVRAEGSDFAERADKLLRELHDHILVDAMPTFDVETQTLIEKPNSVGFFGREAIYYGPEGFYEHQFAKFARLRYRDDADWLVQNVGLSIRPILDITKFLVDRINAQMTLTGRMRSEGATLSNSDLTDSLIVSKAELRDRFKDKADAYLAKFATPVMGANAGFNEPFAINGVSLAPIIDLGDYLYIPNQYRLFESVYESPFFWMMADKAYANTHAEHRGAFLEKTTAHILRTVFGEENVHENVIIKRNAHDRGGEVDVLVVYGEFVIVAQDKSKRVTLKARAGDAAALTTDFKGAIQDPYEQAMECIELLRSGATCETKDGRSLALHSHPRFFPMVVLSDTFPASTMLSHTMLTKGNNVAPVIWDIGVLDCVSRLLPTPIELLFYLKSRSDVFDTIMSDSEYNYLGYHIRAKLALDPEADGMMLDQDFATPVDDFMIAADIGLDAPRPKGVLERLEIPVISELLTALKQAPPEVASVVIDLYDFSGAALADLSATILDLREEVSKTGKAIKAFSIRTGTGGLTYAVTSKRDARAAAAAQAIGAKHKYDQKCDRWYVILDCVNTPTPVDGLLPLVWPWEEDQDQAAASAQVAKMFKSTEQAVRIGDAAARRKKK